MFVDDLGILTSVTPPTSMTLANNNPGTTAQKLLKFTGAPSKGTITAITDTNNAIGICTAGCGNTGNATIQYDGITTCVFDGATTANDFFTLSATIAGDCHDTGSAIAPTNGFQPIGIVLSTNGAGGTYSVYFSTINGAINNKLSTGFAFIFGTVTASQVVYYPTPIPVTYPATFGSGNTFANCSVNPSESDQYTIKSGGVTLGTITLSTSCVASYSTSSGSHASVAGEQVEIDAPATVSGNVSIAVQVTR
jgi:hypothetical protein